MAKHEVFHIGWCEHCIHCCNCYYYSDYVYCICEKRKFVEFDTEFNNKEKEKECEYFKRY